MSDNRCPRCGAVLPATAQWCSLCYYDLRAPVAPTVPVPPPAPIAPSAPVMPVMPVMPVPPAAPAAPVAPAQLQPFTVAPPVAAQQPVLAPLQPQEAAEPMWPCPKCGTAVPMSLDHCTVCGAGFLADARTGNSIKVPILGEVGTLTTGRKVMIGVVITISLIVILLVVGTIAGKLL